MMRLAYDMMHEDDDFDRKFFLEIARQVSLDRSCASSEVVEDALLETLSLRRLLPSRNLERVGRHGLSRPSEVAAFDLGLISIRRTPS